MMAAANPPRRRILHVVYRFDIGGLENVIVQLINRLPSDRFEHAVMALTEVTDFRWRVTQAGVEFVALHKSPGHAFSLYPRIYRWLRAWRPDVVHTCNLAALEVTPLAWLAGVPMRVHAEHGWDATDPVGASRKNQMIRRLYQCFVSQYVAVSQDLQRYLTGPVGTPPDKVALIPNGVDTDVFGPAVGSVVGSEAGAASGTGETIAGCPFAVDQCWLIGTVGRLQTVKNQTALARAFVLLLTRHPAARRDLRLLIIGEGPARAQIEAILAAGGVTDLVWLPGARNDGAANLRRLHCFVLPSLAEGTSCTLQEAMAAALPVVASAVGGTPDLVQAGVTGKLVKPDDDEALAGALWDYYCDQAVAMEHGRCGRARFVAGYTLDGMVANYAPLFNSSER